MSFFSTFLSTFPSINRKASLSLLHSCFCSKKPPSLSQTDSAELVCSINFFVYWPDESELLVLWNIANESTGRTKCGSLQPRMMDGSNLVEGDHKLASHVNSFYVNKIAGIRDKIDSAAHTTGLLPLPPPPAAAAGSSSVPPRRHRSTGSS